MLCVYQVDSKPDSDHCGGFWRTTYSKQNNNSYRDLQL